jgi:periplasmic protein TonB
VTGSASSVGNHPVPKNEPKKEPWEGPFRAGSLNPRAEYPRERPPRQGAGTHATLWGGAVAIALHALVAIALMLVPQRGLHSERPSTVEVDVVPPTPAEPLPPPLEPQQPDPAPRPVARKPVVHIKPRPMPNRETKPEPVTEEPAKPVFGATQDSVVDGESPVAVPVGNTLMTEDRTLAKTPPQALPAAPPPPPGFVPVPEESITEFPKVRVEIKADYPEIARRMGIGGKVLLRIGVDRNGNVNSVRVVKKLGYGMDEAAEKAIRQAKFDPAKGADGKPVDFVLTYAYSFRPPPER